MTMMEHDSAKKPTITFKQSNYFAKHPNPSDAQVIHSHLLFMEFLSQAQKSVDAGVKLDLTSAFMKFKGSIDEKGNFAEKDEDEKENV